MFRVRVVGSNRRSGADIRACDRMKAGKHSAYHTCCKLRKIQVRLSSRHTLDPKLSALFGSTLSLSQVLLVAFLVGGLG